jgi:S1-C subfamily serine protease
MRGAWCLVLATTHALKPPALDRRSILGAYASLASLPANAAALRQAELETIQLFEKATKSVVFIDTFAEQREAVSMNMDVPQGTGSGFVWDDRGHIVTNYHVIRNAAAADVTLLVDGGTKLSRKAQLRGVDPDKDIAVLTVDDIPKEKLRKIAVGSRRPVSCPSHDAGGGLFFEFEAVNAPRRSGRRRTCGSGRRCSPSAILLDWTTR